MRVKHWQWNLTWYFSKSDFILKHKEMETEGKKIIMSFNDFPLLEQTNLCQFIAFMSAAWYITIFLLYPLNCHHYWGLWIMHYYSVHTKLPCPLYIHIRSLKSRWCSLSLFSTPLSRVSSRPQLSASPFHSVEVLKRAPPYICPRPIRHCHPGSDPTFPASSSIMKGSQETVWLCWRLSGWWTTIELEVKSCLTWQITLTWESPPAACCFQWQKATCISSQPRSQSTYQFQSP